jgi:hypothetical protein
MESKKVTPKYSPELRERAVRMVQEHKGMAKGTRATPDGIVRCSAASLPRTSLRQPVLIPGQGQTPHALCNRFCSYMR